MWDTVQEVTVTGVEDEVDLAEASLMIKHGVSGGDYNQLLEEEVPVVELTVGDNDTSGVRTTLRFQNVRGGRCRLLQSGPDLRADRQCHGVCERLATCWFRSHGGRSDPIANGVDVHAG